MKLCRNLAFLNDLHLGHHQTPTVHIIKSLMAALPDNTETAELDIIFLAGDVFDRLLTYADDCVFEIHCWIVDLLRLCKKYDILLRVLEGTPSHDNRQSRWFVELNESAHINADLAYFDSLAVEYIARFDMHVLYIPDEYSATCEITKQLVIEKLASMGLDQVDYTVMHGAFPHQLPSTIDQRSVHDPSYYLSITREAVVIGHVHFYSQYEWIYAGGSLERLRHNEEGPKGHLRIRRMDTGIQAYFVENRNAMCYVTVLLTDRNETDAKIALDEQVAVLKAGDYIRVKCRKSDAGLAMMPSYIGRHHALNWGYTEVKDKGDERDLIDERIELLTTPINSGNIASLLLERVARNNPHHYDRSVLLLEEVLND